MFGDGLPSAPNSAKRTGLEKLYVFSQPTDALSHPLKIRLF